MHYYRDPDSPSQLAADEGTRQHKRRAPKAVYDEMNRLQRSAQSSPLPPHGDADIRRVLYPKVLDDSFLQPNRHSSKGNKGILPHPRHLLHGHLLHGFSQDVLKASSLACHSITHPAAPVRRQASGKLAPPDPIQIYSRSSQAISIYLSIDRSINQSSTHAHTHTRTHAHTHTHTTHSSSASSSWPGPCVSPSTCATVQYVTQLLPRHHYSNYAPRPITNTPGAPRGCASVGGRSWRTRLGSGLCICAHSWRVCLRGMAWSEAT